MEEKIVSKKSQGTRTFYKDLQAMETQYQNGVLRSVLQQRKFELQREAAKKRRKRMSIVWVFVSIILIAGAFGVSYLAQRLSVPTPPDRGLELPSLFPVDYNLKLETTSQETAEARLAELAGQAFVSPSVVRLVPEAGYILSFRETAEILWPDTPLLVTTSASPNFVLGYHTSKETKVPFLVLEARDFVSLQQGMRYWEETLYQDLLVPFNLPSDDINRHSFKDEFVNNLPVRSMYRGTTIEEEEVVRTPVILRPPVTPRTAATGIESTTASAITLEPTIIEPAIRYEEETIVTKVPGPQERLLFYTTIGGSYIVITTSPDTLSEIIDRLAQR